LYPWGDREHSRTIADTPHQANILKTHLAHRPAGLLVKNAKQQRYIRLPSRTRTLIFDWPHLIAH
jgi:hypothetical protein